MALLNIADALRVGGTTVDKVYAGTNLVWEPAGSGPTGYAAEVMADSPLAYWRLGDPSGTTMTDSSGNSRHGTYIGSPTMQVAGALNSDPDTCVTFDGSNDRGNVTYGSWMNPTTLTLEAWIKTSATGIASILDRDLAQGGITRGWQFRRNGGSLEFVKIAGGVVVVAQAASLNNGAWHHVAATLDGTSCRLYVDGTLVKTAACAMPSANNSWLTIGCNHSTNSDTPAALFNGQIDEAALYGTALSADRIAAHVAAR